MNYKGYTISFANIDTNRMYRTECATVGTYWPTFTAAALYVLTCIRQAAADDINNETKALAERIKNTLEKTGASAWAGQVADKTILVTRHEGSTATLRVIFVDEENYITDDFKGVTAERAADIIIGAREHEGKVLTATLNVVFATREDYERGKQLFDSEGASRLWAGDWDDKRQSIEFCDSMPLDDLERDVRSELDAQGFENYATVDGEEMWV